MSFKQWQTTAPSYGKCTTTPRFKNNSIILNSDNALIQIQSVVSNNTCVVALYNVPLGGHNCILLGPSLFSLFSLFTLL